MQKELVEIMRIKVSSNKELVSEIRSKLKENDFYCPCTIVKNEDTKCICKEFREMPAGSTCHCGLYVKIEE